MSALESADARIGGKGIVVGFDEAAVLSRSLSLSLITTAALLWEKGKYIVVEIWCIFGV